MFLQRLRDFANEEREGFDLPPTFYSPKPIRYLIDVDSDGHLTSPSPVDISDPGNRATRRGTMMMAPNRIRTSKISPLLLADNAEYTLGRQRERSKPERVSAMHSAYLDMIDECADATELRSVRAVSRFLRSDGASRLVLDDDFDLTAWITFRVSGELPIESPEVQRFWADAAVRTNSRILQCVTCGETKPVLDRLRKSVKGIPGPHMSGTTIISANKNAFESYGLEKSQIAPTCADCGEKFTEAVNHMLSDEKYHVWFPSAKVIFWTREETQFNWGQMLSSPAEADVQAQIEALWTGGRRSPIDESAFYGAVLSASGARAVLREWIDTTVGEVKSRLADWFAAQSIVLNRGGPSTPLGIHALAAATVREGEDILASTTRSLVRCALNGSPLQRELLYRAVRRNRAEQRVTRPRATLIKLVLATNDRVVYKEDYMVQLEEENRSPAYLCGRLLYVLQEAQEAAIPGINATVVDRYFGTASTAPAAVFSRLIRGAQPHLSKLQRDNGGAYHAIQRRMTEILEHLPEFPKTLTLEEQGLFSLGYYHQRADQLRRIDERREAAGKTSGTDS